MNRLALALVFAAAMTDLSCAAPSPPAVPPAEAPSPRVWQASDAPSRNDAVPTGNYDQWDLKPHKDKPY